MRINIAPVAICGHVDLIEALLQEKSWAGRFWSGILIGFLLSLGLTVGFWLMTTKRLCRD